MLHSIALEGNMSRKKTSVRKSDVKGIMRFAKRYPILAVIIAVIVVGVFVFQSVQDNANKVTIPMDGLYVHYIDVGQGDSELICCGGEYMLIDAGEPSASDTVVDYLNDHGIEKLEYVVCSHGHADHCGGLDAVVENFDVGTVFTSPYPGDTSSYEIFSDAVSAKGLAMTVPELGESYSLGEARFEFIGPLEEYDNLNDNSLVMRLEYGDTSFLFTGDMTSKAERDLLEDGANVKCDVLKVGHHGSSGSSSYRFLYEAEPKIAVISCEAGNSYGHPHEEALSRLNDCGAEVCRTDLEGSIIIFSNGMEVTKKAA